MSNQWDAQKKKTRKKGFLSGILKKLRFCTARISNYADIDIPPQIDALMGDFMDTTQKHEQDCPLDIMVTENCGSYAINNLVEEIRCIPHSAEFLYFLFLDNGK